MVSYSYRSGRAGMPAAMVSITAPLTIIMIILVWLKLAGWIAWGWEWVFAPLWLFMAGSTSATLIAILRDILRYE